MTVTPVRPRRSATSGPSASSVPCASSDASAPSPSRRLPAALPGLAVSAVAVGIAWGAHELVPSLSPLTAAVALGVLAGNLRLLPAATRPGLGVAAKRVMRIGIVLLGLKLALGDVLGLGWQTLLVVAVTLFATFFGTQWLGRKAGLPGDQPLLIATGFSICGASAVAAMNGVTESEERDTVTAVALVTLCGSLAIAVLPLLRHPLGLDPMQFGRWAGASVHDVGQVVAVGQTAGPAALAEAVVVKLMRVALLAPIVTGVALVRSRRRAAQQNTTQDATQDTGQATKRPAPVPLFLVGFLACVAIRSTGLLSAGTVNIAGTVDDLLMAAALFALGAAVDIRTLVRTGRRALLVGLASWVMIAGVAYAGVLATT
ncbi:YeiH family protein [Streptacidiphilus fuscans]|uniref:YeiH family protein n=1 Tax=Streptacidiphilus fuscans TaxID=2789292 RepID=UPI002E27BA5F|nr:putative sulfate exporter family transporter [Streptacidiphilus fuscans]